MVRLKWLRLAKTLATSIAFTYVAVATSTNAYADYSYTFGISGINDGIIGPITGNFTVSSLPNISSSNTSTSASYSYNKDGVVHNGNNGSIYIQYNQIYIQSFGSTSFLSFGSQNASYTDTTIKGSGYVQANGSTGTGFFEAMLNSGPSGGGGGGGGSGGAPSPEVNASLGLLLAGATFAFLRRKRGGRHEATAA